jgi:tRNA (guanosine-2'-O-)-methyltransferase
MDSSRQCWTGATHFQQNLPVDYFLPKPFAQDLGALETFFLKFITQERLAKFHRVARQRSRAVAPVFEDTHHTHNISAILRKHALSHF